MSGETQIDNLPALLIQAETVRHCHACFLPFATAHLGTGRMHSTGIRVDPALSFFIVGSDWTASQSENENIENDDTLAKNFYNAQHAVISINHCVMLCDSLAKSELRRVQRHNE